jgi:hypothetical protein
MLGNNDCISGTAIHRNFDTTLDFWLRMIPFFWLGLIIWLLAAILIWLGLIIWLLAAILIDNYRELK